MLQAGTKVNALPASATANVNCRILPDETIEQTQARLGAIIGDPEVKITPALAFEFGPPSPITGEFIDALTKVTSLRRGAACLTLIPTLVPGGTDSRFFRQKGVPAYGWNAIAGAEVDSPRSHGIDEERQQVEQSVKPGLEAVHEAVPPGSLELAASRRETKNRRTVEP